mgnify:CR=1 FL=1
MTQSPIPQAISAALVDGAYGDPFGVLGPHETPGGWRIATLLPGAEGCTVLHEGGAWKLDAVEPRGLFAGKVPAAVARGAYRLRWREDGHDWEAEDPYRFGPVLGALDEHLISEGSHLRLWERLGAHPMVHEGAEGVHFAVWAPGVARASVVGPFVNWDGRRLPMRARGESGVWEIFVPGLKPGEPYKFEFRTAKGAVTPQKADPLGFGSQHPPATASVVRDIRSFPWGDGEWMAARETRNRKDAPISIYEVHLGSWRRRLDENGRPLSYAELARDLVPYVADLGFTHLEFMPVNEHPFDGSWGYQPVGLYAPTIRHGTPAEFRGLIDAAHRAGLGVILDWVPGHFPVDDHGVGKFIGAPLYEHADPREGFHPDWNTLIYDFGRIEVANYLLANALYWLKEHHADGLRVDAVASMLYRDYSRKAGEWVPNRFGGRENLEAVEFLRRVNTEVYGEFPGAMTVAEESTAWPGVSRPVHDEGLGFGFKWNMGWMNDTLRYMARDPIHRRHHHHEMTFASSYAFSENFVLPLSHDEVVHGKGALWDKMPGAPAEKFANLRALYGFMWGHPGKKLLFMGGEFAQRTEWRHFGELDWGLLDRPRHAGVRALIRDLNRLYRETPALHLKDCDPGGFGWIDADDAENSIYAFARFGRDGDAPALVVSNMTPVERRKEIGAPSAGPWRIRIDTSSERYGGAAPADPAPIEARAAEWRGWPATLDLTIPPLSTLILTPA